MSESETHELLHHIEYGIERVYDQLREDAREREKQHRELMEVLRAISDNVADGRDFASDGVEMLRSLIEQSNAHP